MYWRLIGGGVSLEDLKEFDNLPYEHKIVFTHVPQPEIKSSFYIKGFEKNAVRRNTERMGYG